MMSLRIGRLIAALLCLTGSCRNPDWPAYHAPIILQAFTSTAASAGATDSIVCSVYVQLPIADTIPSAWSGQATVRVGRWTVRATATPPKDTLLADVPVEIASHATDSLRVTISGPAPMVFDGKFIGDAAAYPREATGTWTCDDRVPLASAVPGKATGLWLLFPARTID
ncbi:MAG: hypothetical protein ACJ8AD_20830 [Gemmatimonadaceae bacterium]